MGVASLPQFVVALCLVEILVFFRSQGRSNRATCRLGHKLLMRSFSADGFLYTVNVFKAEQPLTGPKRVPLLNKKGIHHQ